MLSYPSGFILGTARTLQGFILAISLGNTQKRAQLLHVMRHGALRLENLRCVVNSGFGLSFVLPFVSQSVLVLCNGLTSENEPMQHGLSSEITPSLYLLLALIAVNC